MRWSIPAASDFIGGLSPMVAVVLPGKDLREVFRLSKGSGEEGLRAENGLPWPSKTTQQSTVCWSLFSILFFYLYHIESITNTWRLS